LIPNPKLRPEYAYNAELNLNKEFLDLIKVNVTGFYTWLDKAMVRRPTSLNGQSEMIYDGELSQLFSIQNAAFVEVLGIQAGMELALSPRLSLSSNYNWQKGVEELDDASTSPSRHAAPAFGVTKLRFQRKWVTLELSSHYSAAMPFDKMPQEEIAKPLLYAIDSEGNPFSPSWKIFNFNARLPVYKQVQLTLGIENLSDQQYRGYSSGIISPGRNFQFSLLGRF